MFTSRALLACLVASALLAACGGSDPFPFGPQGDSSGQGSTETFGGMLTRTQTCVAEPLQTEQFHDEVDVTETDQGLTFQDRVCQALSLNTNSNQANVQLAECLPSRAFGQLEATTYTSGKLTLEGDQLVVALDGTATVRSPGGVSEVCPVHVTGSLTRHSAQGGAELGGTQSAGNGSDPALGGAPDDTSGDNSSDTSSSDPNCTVNPDCASDPNCANDPNCWSYYDQGNSGYSDPNSGNDPNNSGYNDPNNSGYSDPNNSGDNSNDSSSYSDPNNDNSNDSSSYSDPNNDNSNDSSSTGDSSGDGSDDGYDDCSDCAKVHNKHGHHKPKRNVAPVNPQNPR